MNHYIKYFYNSSRCAKNLGLHREYLFYLKLKCFDNGYLHKGSITKKLQHITSYSPASISIYIKKLTQCGFLATISSEGKVIGYQVESYKKVLRILGVKIRFSGKNKNVAKEHRFKRILISKLRENAVFKNYVEMLDIYDNSTKQFYRRQQVLKRKIKYHRSTLKANDLKKESIIKELNDELKSVLADKGNQFQLSCKKLSRILGYKSIQQGSLIERRSESNSFLNISRHMEIVEKKVPFEEFMVMKVCDNTLYWMFGNVVKNQCNQLTFNQDFFSHFESNKQNTLSNQTLQVQIVV